MNPDPDCVNPDQHHLSFAKRFRVGPLCAVLVTLALAGCTEDAPHADVVEAASSPVAQIDRGAMGLMKAAPALERAGADAVESNPDAGNQRRIVEVQTWHYELSPSTLESVWQSHRDACTAQGPACDILSANLALRGPDQGARHAVLEVRVARERLDTYLGMLESSGPAPIERTITRDDRTLQWVDLQARVRSSEQLRDRLSSLVQNPKTDKLSDLIALERELNRVQSSLDAMTAQARVMAQETERVRLNIQYRSAPTVVARDMWSPIRDAWFEMGSTFTSSLAAVMLFVATALPWIVILVPGWVLLKKLWARIRRRGVKQEGLTHARM